MTPAEALTTTRDAVIELHKWDAAAVTPARRELQAREPEALSVLEKALGLSGGEALVGSKP